MNRSTQQKLIYSRLRTAVMILTVLLLVNSCDKNEELIAKIGYIYSAEDSWQVEALNSVDLFEANNKEYLNCNNGNKIKYKIIRYRTEQKPESSVRTFQTATNKDKVIAVVTSLISESALPVAFSAERVGIPTVAAASTNVQLARNLQFVRAISMDDELQAEIFSQYILQHNNNAKVAIIYDVTSPYSRDLASYFKQGFLKRDGNIHYFKGYIPANDKLEDIVDQALQKGANIFVLPNFYKDIKVLVKRIAIKDERAVIYGTDSWELKKLIDQPGIDGSQVLDQWHQGMIEHNIVAKQYVTDLKSLYHGNITGGMVRSYDALLLMRKAICSANQINTYSIAGSLRSIRHLEGIAGSYIFHEDGKVDKPMAVVSFRNGKTDFVEAIEGRANAKF